jgi:hypothetical protein
LTARERKAAVEAKNLSSTKRRKRGIPHFEDSVRNDGWAFFGGLARAALRMTHAPVLCRVSAVRLVRRKRGIPHFEDSVRNDGWALFSG